MAQRRSIHDVLGISPGHYIVESIEVSDWGKRVRVQCRYNYPPQVLQLTLRFDECRYLEWHVQPAQPNSATLPVQLLTHDLGLPRYERTARLATTAAELILSYRSLKIERE